MFHEENSLIMSSTAGVRIKEITMSDRSTLSCLIYKMMACNMASFLGRTIIQTTMNLICERTH